MHRVNIRRVRRPFRPGRAAGADAHVPQRIEDDQYRHGQVEDPAQTLDLGLLTVELLGSDDAPVTRAGGLGQLIRLTLRACGLLDAAAELRLLTARVRVGCSRILQPQRSVSLPQRIIRAAVTSKNKVMQTCTPWTVGCRSAPMSVIMTFMFEPATLQMN